MNKISKKNAITLVELIIALTMVSVLMLTMFSVIFKKTKATILSPSGTFYCWKDWEGNLHQKIIVTGRQDNSDDINELRRDRIVSKCELDFPKYLTKNSKVKTWLIGGGAAGKKYVVVPIETYIQRKEHFCSSHGDYKCPADYDTKIKKVIEEEFNCFNYIPENDVPTVAIGTPSGELLKIRSYELQENNGCSIGNDWIKKDSNLKTDKKGRDYCIVTLYDEKGKKQKYAVMRFSKLSSKNLLYSFGGEIGDKECNPYPFIFDKTNNDFLDVNSLGAQVLESKIIYKKLTKITFRVSEPKTQDPKIEPIDDAGYDLNKPFSISKDDIGDGGTYMGGNNGWGGDTVLKVGGKEIARAKGISVTSKKEPVNVPADVIGSNPAEHNTCCMNNNSTCFLQASAPVSKELGISTPEPVNIDYCGDKPVKYPSDSFGYFGSNGAPNKCKVKYHSYLRIDVGKSSGPNYEFITVNDNDAINDTDCKTVPGNGMGGAIVIKWY